MQLPYHVRVARGFAMLFLTLVPAYFQCVYVLGPMYVLRFFNVSLHRHLVGFLMSSYWTTMMFWFEVVNGTKFYFTGDAARKTDEHVLIINNHLNEADIPYLYAMPLRAGALHMYRYISKKMVKFVPIIGWGSHFCEFIWLARSIEKDERMITERLKSFTDPLWIVLFPEGTDYGSDTDKKVAKSQAYQQKMGLPILHNVLQPRTKGAYLCIDAMRSNGREPIVYDQTFAYLPETPGNPLGVLAGDITALHIHMRRCDGRELGTTEEEVGKWLNKSFKAKDDLMVEFRAKGHFGSATPSTPPPLGRMVVGVTFHSLIGVGCGYLLYHSSTARWWAFIWSIILQLWVIFTD